MIDRHSNDALNIVEDCLTGQEIADLLATHLEFARASSPSCAVHSFEIERLRAPDITFWSAWRGDFLLGCVALKELSPDHGEIKSMHTTAASRRSGIGGRLLTHLLDIARQRGYQRLSLETGSTAPFAPAHRLYEQYGFRQCPPFGEYVDDGFSMCMTRKL